MLFGDATFYDVLILLLLHFRRLQKTKKHGQTSSKSGQVEELRLRFISVSTRRQPWWDAQHRDVNRTAMSQDWMAISEPSKGHRSSNQVV
jgi:hypothetical protein